MVQIPGPAGPSTPPPPRNPAPPPRPVPPPQPKKAAARLIDEVWFRVALAAIGVGLLLLATHYFWPIWFLVALSPKRWWRGRHRRPIDLDPRKFWHAVLLTAAGERRTR